MNLFWTDAKRQISKEYWQLFEDLNHKNTLRRYISFENPYQIFLELIHSLVTGQPIELLDHDFSAKELADLGIGAGELHQQRDILAPPVSSHAELLELIEKNKETWRLTLYTSGTTGIPKKIVHHFDTLTRNVRLGERHQGHVWGFAYNPSHFAGLMVFFQALLNGNAMVNIYDCPREELATVLTSNGVTHLSATPTFYRTVFPYIGAAVPSVLQLTSGGERFDALLVKEITRRFPNARILNIYASTEAGSLFVSKDERFFIDAQQRDLFRVSGSGELFIHKSLVGQGLDGSLQGDWYPSGDIVERTPDDEIRFISRENDIINVAGYNVNPLEVEEEIKKIKGVVDVAVSARSNRLTGNILVADVVVEDWKSEKGFEEEILDLLSKTFQAWKVPRLIRFVGEIAKGRTGKKVRR